MSDSPEMLPSITNNMDEPETGGRYKVGFRSIFTRRRLLRISIKAFMAIVTIYVVLNFGIAWLFTFILTHPGCRKAPKPVQGLSAYEEIWLHTDDNLELRAWYYPAQNGAAIMAFGGMGGALGENLPPVGILVQRGYGVLQVDSRACAKPAAPVSLGYDEVRDAAAGLVFLESRPEVRYIGVIGFSMGGVTAIRAAARYPKIAAVVAEGGYFNLGDDFVEPDSNPSIPHRIFSYSIAYMYWLNSGVNPWLVSPIDDIPTVSPRPVFLIYGEHEAENGRAEAQFAAAKEPKRLWIVPGGTHGTNHLAAPEEYSQRIIEFFDQTFGNP